MEIITDNEELHSKVSQFRKKGETVGFVPTLGALHDGHASLIRKSKRTSDKTICSIFVNPTQFNDPKDLEKYPRTFDSDSKLLRKLSTNILYMPSAEAVYPKNLDTSVNVDFGDLFAVLEGAHRPGHFEGVVQVVKRLLDLVRPDYLYMGQKDFQQFTIINHMINELALPVELVVCRTKREEHGLAMSSRNLRLEPDIRNRAAVINTTLKSVRRKIKTHSFDELRKFAIEKMTIPDFSPEYFDIIDGNTLHSLNFYDQSEYIVACTAVWAKNIRLIDNRIMKKSN